MPRTTALLFTLAIFIWRNSPITAADAAPPKPVDFTHDVKPLLAAKCYACHGPDEGKRKGKLRLDEADAAIKKVIKPGDAAASLFVKRISTDDVAEIMPPTTAKTGPLTPAQIDLLRRWVEQGAKFDLHWAYVQPTRPALPAVKNKGWVVNAIDAFIADGQERQALQPAPPADRITLIRRLTFDLTGLPPSPEDVETFVKNQSPDAYEMLVDRLLASPHFGERMASYWLDMVRYADTAGYHSDNPRDVYLYRNYVINAFNSNKPFDRFTVEQPAGDLLPNATAEQRIASGYNRLLQTTEEGGAQSKEYTAKYAADRVRNASVVWMASTMGCAQCHSHKFDPFTQKDFYSFAAFFADVKETAVGRQEQTPFPSKEQEAALHQLDEQIAASKNALERSTPDLDVAQAEWEKTATVGDAAKKAPADAKAALAVETAKRTPQQKQAITAYFRTIAPQLQAEPRPTRQTGKRTQTACAKDTDDPGDNGGRIARRPPIAARQLAGRQRRSRDAEHSLVHETGRRDGPSGHAPRSGELANFTGQSVDRAGLRQPPLEGDVR